MDAAPQPFRALSATEAIYVRTATQVVSRSRVHGQMSAAQFAVALAQLEARYEILRTALYADRFVARPATGPKPFAWLSSELVDPDTLLERLLDRPLDLDAQVYEVQVVVRPGLLDVFLLTSHAVTDATALIELHSFLAHCCDCVARGVVPEIEPQPIPDSVDLAVSRSLAALGPADGAPVPAAHAGEYLRLPTRAAPPGEAIRHRLERLVIGAATVRRLIAAGHAHGVSLHSLLVAAFARAVRELAESTAPRILMRSSIDLRRRVEPHLPTSLVQTAITGHVTGIDDMSGSLQEIAQRVFDDIHGDGATRRMFCDYVSYPQTFASGADVPIALNISDMGAVDLHAATEMLQITGFDYALGWLKKYPNTSITILDGELVANTVYVEQFVAPGLMRRMSELVRAELDRVAGADGTP